MALHPCQGKPLAYFLFWQPEIPDFDHTNLDQHKRILEDHFAGMGWRVPEFMEAVRAASDMYFDSVARVDVANWARGRIALLGDASSCVSLFGDGSTLAIAGAYELANAVMAKNLHDVPQHRLPADLDHGLGAQIGFFGNPCTQSACEDDCFHNDKILLKPC